jgi:hypothetical protein
VITGQERQEGVDAFDAEANEPRDGWTRAGKLSSRVELWTRDHAGLSAVVCGLASNATGAGAWNFAVKNGDEIVASGESSRRGWAMDGANNAMPARH